MKKYLVQGGRVSSLFVNGEIVREGEWFIPQSVVIVPKGDAMRMAERMASKFDAVAVIPASSTRELMKPRRMDK